MVLMVGRIHRKTTLAVEGFFINKKKQNIEFNEKSFASLDDTQGFLRPETAWFWLSCNFWDATVSVSD